MLLSSLALIKSKLAGGVLVRARGGKKFSPFLNSMPMYLSEWIKTQKDDQIIERATIVDLFNKSLKNYNSVTEICLEDRDPIDEMKPFTLLVIDEFNYCWDLYGKEIRYQTGSGDYIWRRAYLGDEEIYIDADYQPDYQPD